MPVKTKPTKAPKSGSANSTGKRAPSGTPSVFIDGEAGTTGIEIRERLQGISGITVRSIAAELRKDADARRALMSGVDVVILCLPDDAAKEAAKLAGSLGETGPRIIDASSAHRVSPGWVYGFAELDPAQKAAIRSARHVTNPGCYPTGGIALLRPLVAAGLMAADHPVTVNAVSGYSGGGSAMIEAYEAKNTPSKARNSASNAPSFELYGLGLEHKHVPELQRYSQLSRRPIFVPSVGNFRKGMLVSVPLHLDTLPGKPKAADLEAALTAHYAGAKLVKVIAAGDKSSAGGRLEAEGVNDTDLIELRVFANEAHRQAVLVARLDNLGKGASGAAVQNLQIMLGLD